ncbi:glutathione S-transferase family protein [Sphingomonas albertensis]|uniref:Glutathione S-transferase family protein n=1 Tax=Sphingomonas albertensis TaxID=2762591 RepID=A0ABR7AT18_9SPHN|nr:glutathione S-transferase family protein [Sphingomonas albertensis]MBC3943586.1 glutathione S-transferase family protein [Sphingomonas albertensis]
MALTLYTNPMSRGRIARWMLEEVGAAYETVVLGYDTTMKAEAYRAINPMAKVPALVHNGKTITECAAICAYLAETFPDAGLAPHADERADYYRWLFYAAGPVESAITNRSLGVVPTDAQQRMVGYGSFDAVVDVLERAISAHPYIAGDRFTAADVYGGSQILFGLQFGSLPKREIFGDYAARLIERPAYKRAGELDDALIAAAA